MPKASKGCWTCRLRRKKCDETQPTCRVCESLEISCHYGQASPEWMDRGKRQREMAQRLKVEVRKSAERQRNRKLLQTIPRDVVDEMRSGSSSGQASPVASRTHTSISPPTETSPEARAYSTVGEALTSTELTSPEDLGSRPPDPSRGITLDLQPTTLPARNELELSLLMAYIDYVFPVLFPFYRPSLFDGGRSWLFVLNLRHEALFHITTSLTTYFVSVVPFEPGPGQQICASYSWAELQKQTELTVKVVRRDLLELDKCADVRLESSNLLNSIVHLLNLEAMVFPLGNWKIHLDAAVALFEQILQNHGRTADSDTPKLAAVLDKIGCLSQLTSPSDSSIYGVDQASLRFFCATLVFYDILYSTSGVHPPRLQPYHEELLPISRQSRSRSSLPLDEVIGCQNWVFHIICRVSDLDRWKKTMKKSGTLSMWELTKRGIAIEQDIVEGLAQVDDADIPYNTHSETYRLFKVMKGSKLDDIGPRDPTPAKVTTRIWAYAVRTYLHVVISGWQPANPEIRESVTHTIELLQDLPSPGWLRILAWPFCVTGCLATEQQEAIFRDLVASMGGLEMFGTIRVALNIMEQVWRQREEIRGDWESWDVAACLNSLGHEVLLV